MRAYLAASGSLDCLAGERVRQALQQERLTGEEALTDAQVGALARRLSLQEGIAVRGVCEVDGPRVKLDVEALAVKQGTAQSSAHWPPVEGPAESAPYLVMQLAHQVHLYLTGEWATGVDRSKVATKDIEIIEDSNPAEKVEKAESSIRLKVELDKQGTDYQPGNKMTVTVRADQTCYVAVYNVDSSGEVTLLFPNQWDESNRLEKGQPVVIPDRDDTWELKITEGGGEEEIIVLASEKQLKFPGAEVFKEEALPRVARSIHTFVNGDRGKKTKGVVAQMKVPDGDSAPPDPWSSSVVRFFVSNSKKMPAPLPDTGGAKRMPAPTPAVKRMPAPTPAVKRMPAPAPGLGGQE